MVNLTTEAFPLGSLRLGDGKDATNGPDWGIAMLENGACVVAWKDEGDPQAPEGLTCNEVGELLTRRKQDRFWKDEFHIYYDEELIGTCEEDQEQCSINIPTQASYRLLIAKRDEDGLFVVNLRTEAFPLEPLRLGDGESAINGIDWDIALLEDGSCVTVWKDEGNPRPPEGLTCSEVGERLTRRKPDRFWREAFNVYYEEELINTCEKEQENCFVTVPIK